MTLNITQLSLPETLAQWYLVIAHDEHRCRIYFDALYNRQYPCARAESACPADLSVHDSEAMHRE